MLKMTLATKFVLGTIVVFAGLAPKAHAQSCADIFGVSRASSDPAARASSIDDLVNALTVVVGQTKLGERPRAVLEVATLFVKDMPLDGIEYVAAAMAPNGWIEKATLRFNKKHPYNESSQTEMRSFLFRYRLANFKNDTYSPAQVAKFLEFRTSMEASGYDDASDQALTERYAIRHLASLTADEFYDVVMILPPDLRTSLVLKYIERRVENGTLEFADVTVLKGLLPRFGVGIAGKQAKKIDELVADFQKVQMKGRSVDDILPLIDASEGKLREHFVAALLASEEHPMSHELAIGIARSKLTGDAKARVLSTYMTRHSRELTAAESIELARAMGGDNFERIMVIFVRRERRRLSPADIEFIRNVGFTYDGRMALQRILSPRRNERTQD